jgi:ferredoxin
MTNIEVNKEKCTECGLCAAVCPVGIFKKKDDKVIVIEKLIERNCVQCGQCAVVCPSSAISLNGSAGIEEERFDGEILKKQIPLLIRQRRSVRTYKSQPVTAEDIKPILDAVRYAPTAKNQQKISYTLLIGQSLDGFVKYCYDNISKIGLDGFKDAYYNKKRDVLFRDAPAVLIASAPKELNLSSTDCIIALSLFDAFAQVFNIGTCWAGYLMNLAGSDGNMSKFLNLKDGNAVYGILLLGHSKVKYLRTPVRKPVDIEIKE